MKAAKNKQTAEEKGGSCLANPDLFLAVCPRTGKFSVFMVQLNRRLVHKLDMS